MNDYVCAVSTRLDSQFNFLDEASLSNNHKVVVLGNMVVLALWKKQLNLLKFFKYKSQFYLQFQIKLYLQFIF